MWPQIYFKPNQNALLTLVGHIYNAQGHMSNNQFDLPHCRVLRILYGLAHAHVERKSVVIPRGLVWSRVEDVSGVREGVACEEFDLAALVDCTQGCREVIQQSSDASGHLHSPSDGTVRKESLEITWRHAHPRILILRLVPRARRRLEVFGQLIRKRHGQVDARRPRNLPIFVDSHAKDQ